MSERKIKNVKNLGGQQGKVLRLPKNVKNLGGSTEKEMEKIWVGKGEVEGWVEK